MEELRLVLMGVGGLALLSVILAFASLMQTRRLAGVDILTRDVALQLLRTETDIIRKAADDQSRGLREELNAALRGNQDSTINAFRALGENLDTQTRGFGDRLDAGIKTVGLKLDNAAERSVEEAANLRNELNASFHRLGGSVSDTLQKTSEQQKERLELSTRAIESLTEKSERLHESLRQSVESRLDAIRQESATKLDEMRQTVDEKLQTTLEQRLGESFERVMNQLKSVHDGLGEMKNLASNVGDLRNLLSNVKIRGTFGEIQLEALLEQFLSPDQYKKNVAVRPNSKERVEFAIRMPGKAADNEVLLSIDAKFPRESYEKLTEALHAGDVHATDSHRKQLENQIRNWARDIAEKYVNPPYTTDFAILFLPTEGLYAEVLRIPGLFESIHREHKVTLAGPTTLVAFLNALQMGFRSIAIEKRSSEVWQTLAAVQNEFLKYNKVVEQLGRQLNSAATSVEHLGKRTRIMTKTLKNVESLPEDVSPAGLLGFDGDDFPSEIILPADHPEPAPVGPRDF